MALLIHLPKVLSTSEILLFLHCGLDVLLQLQCKKSMKVVKKSLKDLGNPDSSLSDKELVLHMKQCLLKIGNRISEILSDYRDPVKIKEWRRSEPMTRTFGLNSA